MSITIKFAALCSFLGIENGFESTRDGVYLQVADIEKLNGAISAFKQLEPHASRIIELKAEKERFTAERDGYRMKAEAYMGQANTQANKPW